MTGQLPFASGRSISSHASCVEPLRPACPSCRPILQSVWTCTNCTMRRHAATCSGAYRPVQPGVIRASGATQVISVNMSPAPPTAREP